MNEGLCSSEGSNLKAWGVGKGRGAGTFLLSSKIKEEANENSKTALGKLGEPGLVLVTPSPIET